MTHKIIPNQSLFDIAVQKYGTIDSLFAILAANGLNLETNVDAGTEIILPDYELEKKQIKSLFESRATMIATTANDIPFPTLVVGGGTDDVLINAQTIQNGGFNATLSNLNTIENGN